MTGSGPARGAEAKERGRQLPVQWMVAAASFVLAAYFAAAQPVDLGGPEARLSPPDESAHVMYLEELVTRRRLPVFRSGHGNYEAHQPPLYYVAAAPAYAALATAGKAAAVRALRLVNCAVGAVAVLVIWELAGFVFPASRAGRALATAAAALWPGRLIAVAAVSNDAAAELAAAVALVVILRVATRPLAMRRAVAAGAWIAVAMLVKSSTLPLVVVGMAAVYAAWRRSGEREAEFVKAAGALVGGFVAVWGWWGVRNTILYGDPLAAAAFQEIFTRDRATPEFFISRGLTGLQYYALVVVQTAKSFWGVLGQANVFMPPAIYWAGGMWWATGLALGCARVAAAIGARRRGAEVADRPARQAKGRGKREHAVDGNAGGETAGDEQAFGARTAWVVLSLHLVLTFALFLRFNAVFYQAQARYFLPATAAMGALMAWPWVWPRKEVAWVGGLWLATVTLAVVGADLAGMTLPAG